MCVCLCVESERVCLAFVKQEEMKPGSNSTYPQSDNGMQQGEGVRVCGEIVCVT